MPNYEVEFGGRKFRVQAADPDAAAIAAEEAFNRKAPGEIASAPKLKGASAAIAKGPNINPPEVQGPEDPNADPGGWRDLGKSILAGPGNAATGMLGLPGDMRNLMQTGVDKVGDWLGIPSRRAPGAPPSALSRQAGMRSGLTQQEIQANIVREVDKIGSPEFSEILSGAYEPKTSAGGYGKAASTGLSGGILNPRQALRYGVAPEVAGEAAGQATKDTWAEPYARTAASLGTGLAGAGQQFRRNALGEIAERGLEGTTAAERAAAQQLMRDSAARGQELLPDEALATVRGGRTTGLGSTVRISASMPGTRQRFNQAYADRAAESERQFNDFMSTVNPPGNTLDTPQAAQAFARQSEQAINDATAGQANTQVAPLYEGQNYRRIPQRDMRPLNALTRQRQVQIPGARPGNPQTINVQDGSGRINQAMDEVNASPLDVGLDPARVMPDQYGYWHKIRQNLQDQLTAAREANPRSALVNSIGRQENAVDTVLKRNPAIAMADRIRASAGEAKREADNRIIGQNAQVRTDGAGGETMQGQLRRNMLPTGAEGTGLGPQVREAVDAVARRDRPAAQKVVADMISHEWRDIRVPPGDQFKAARVARAFDDPERLNRAQDALRGLTGNDAAAQGFGNLMQWFRSQGFRQPAGSQTAFNDIKNLNAESRASFDAPKVVGEKIAQFRTWMRQGELADVLLAPDAIEQLERLAKLNPRQREFGPAAVLMITNATAPRKQWEEEQ